MATNYYVATDGDDADPGTLAEPFLTIQHGIDQATTAGDAVYVRAGTYVEALTLDNAGTSGSPITVSGYADERPILDGEYTLPTGAVGGTCDASPYLTFTWNPLVSIEAAYNVFEQFEVKRSGGRAIRLWPNDHDSVIDVIVHDCRYSGIDCYHSDYHIIEDCVVYLTNDYCPHSRGASAATWGAGIAANGSSYTEIRRCTVYNNWGEGITPLDGCDHITVEDCITYDNFSCNLYIERTSYSTFRRNLVYHTNESTFWRGGQPCPGIAISDETGTEGNLCTDNDVLNNIVIGHQANISWWDSGVSGAGLINTVIAGNTLIEAVTNNGGNAVGLSIASSGNHSGNTIEDNITYQTTGTLAIVPSNVSLDYNCWYDGNTNTPETDAQGANDVNDNPDLVDPTHALVAGSVQAIWYKLLSVSPCREAGIAITELTDDHWETTRSDPPDIGAHEYEAAAGIAGVICMII